MRIFDSENTTDARSFQVPPAGGLLTIGGTFGGSTIVTAHVGNSKAGPFVPMVDRDKNDISEFIAPGAVHIPGSEYTWIELQISLPSGASIIADFENPNLIWTAVNP